MKVLQVDLDDGGSRSAGGAIAMNRLNGELRNRGIDSQILCEIKTPNLSHSIQIQRSMPLDVVDRVLGRIFHEFGLTNINRLSTFPLLSSKEFLDADLIHIQGIRGGYFNYLALPVLSRRKPVVLTLHDMWFMTGHCFASMDCERWKSGCGDCPYPDIHPKIKRDFTRIEWKLKDWVYHRSHLSFIAVSHKRTEQAREGLLGRFPIYHIPNGVNTKVFRPLDRKQCRASLGIPLDKHVIMFAASRLGRYEKGSDLLKIALSSLPKFMKERTMLVTLGQEGGEFSQGLGIPSKHFGYVRDDMFKARLYSAADLYLLPSRDDSFPLVILESMACGVPSVAFRVGGVPDLVRPGVTGYLAEPNDTEQFIHGIVSLLTDHALRKELGTKCRKIVEQEYPIELQVERHIQLYKKILNVQETKVTPHLATAAS